MGLVKPQVNLVHSQKLYSSVGETQGFNVMWVSSATLAQNVERAYSSHRSKYDKTTPMIYSSRQSVRSIVNGENSYG